MKYLICIIVFVAVVYGDEPAPSQPLHDLPGFSKEGNALYGQAYAYTDGDGSFYLVKYTPGTPIPYAINRDTKKASNDQGISSNLLKSAINDNDIVKIHHIRNEVPATVHRTHVPESVHAMAPPPVFSRRVIDKHQLPTYNP